MIHLECNTSRPDHTPRLLRVPLTLLDVLAMGMAVQGGKQKTTLESPELLHHTMLWSSVSTDRDRSSLTYTDRSATVETKSTLVRIRWSGLARTTV